VQEEATSHVIKIFTYGDATRTYGVQEEQPHKHVIEVCLRSFSP